MTATSVQLASNLRNAPQTAQIATTRNTGSSTFAATLANTLNVAQGAKQEVQAQESGGMNIGGTYYTPTQIRKFYADGGNERKFLESNGVTDLKQESNMMLQARRIAGAGTMAGETALQNYFQQYKTYNPNGAFANDFNGFVNDIKSNNRAAYDCMYGGTYTGNVTAPSDFNYGGIYGPGTGHDFTFAQSGHGARGMGDGWNEGILGKTSSTS